MTVSESCIHTPRDLHPASSSIFTTLFSTTPTSSRQSDSQYPIPCCFWNRVLSTVTLTFGLTVVTLSASIYMIKPIKVINNDVIMYVIIHKYFNNKLIMVNKSHCWTDWCSLLATNTD